MNWHKSFQLGNYSANNLDSDIEGRLAIPNGLLSKASFKNYLLSLAEPGRNTPNVPTNPEVRRNVGEYDVISEESIFSKKISKTLAKIQFFYCSFIKTFQIFSENFPRICFSSKRANGYRSLFKI